MTIVVLQLKLQLQRIDIFLQPQQWGIPELQLQQLLRRRCNDQVSSGGRRVDDGSPNRFSSSGFSLGQLVFFLPANKADSHYTIHGGQLHGVTTPLLFRANDNRKQLNSFLPYYTLR